MKISNTLVSLFALSTVAFGSVLAVSAQQNSPTLPATPSAPAVETPTTPGGTTPESSPAPLPSTETPPASGGGTPSGASGTEMTPKAGETPPASGGGTPSAAPATEMTPKASDTPPASSGGGSLSEPTSSSPSGSPSKVLAMCGKGGAPLIVEAGATPVGCHESKINAVPAAALK